MSSESDNAQVYVPLYGLQYSRAGVEEGWHWLKEKWPQIVQKVGENLLKNVIPPIVGGISTREQLWDIEAFFSQRDTTAFHRELVQELEKVRTKVAWIERDTASVEAWLIERFVY